MIGRGWHVIRTEPRAEYLAASELSADGFEVFFPCVKVNSPRLGHTDAPLFPGYLFLKWDSVAGNWPVFWPRHKVVGWVTFGGELPWLPDQEMDELIQRCDMINGTGGLWKRFRAGEKVEIVSGTIRGLAEVVQEARSPQARVNVMLEFMGRMVSAQVPWDHLQSVEDTSTENHRSSRRTRGGGRWIRGFGARAPAQA